MESLAHRLSRRLLGREVALLPGNLIRLRLEQGHGALGQAVILVDVRAHLFGFLIQRSLEMMSGI